MLAHSLLLATAIIHGAGSSAIVTEPISIAIYTSAKDILYTIEPSLGKTTKREIGKNEKLGANENRRPLNELPSGAAIWANYLSYRTCSPYPGADSATAVTHVQSVPDSAAFEEIKSNPPLILVLDGNFMSKAVIMNPKTFSALAPPCPTWRQEETVYEDKVGFIVDNRFEAGVGENEAEWVYVDVYANLPSTTPTVSLRLDTRVRDIRIRQDSIFLLMERKYVWRYMLNPLYWLPTLAGHPHQTSDFWVEEYSISEKKKLRTFVLVDRAPKGGAFFVGR
jgi:hypothetical protein